VERAIFVPGLLFFLLAGSACTNNTNGACVSAGAALLITAFDSITGSPVLNAVISAGDESHNVANASFPLGIGFHSGVYNISIKSTGYIDWSQTVTVTSRDDLGCQPNTVTVVARMQRAP
jgi:hypothetical protein